MSLSIENLPCSAMKNIISKIIKDIEKKEDVSNLIKFLGLSKFLNEFDKEHIIEEIYNTLEEKKLIEKEIIESKMNNKKKILTFTQEFFCHNCGFFGDELYDYRNDSDSRHKTIYYKEINNYICGLCVKDLTIDCYKASYKYHISDDILKNLNYIEYGEKKRYFIDHIEEKIKMSIFKYIGFINIKKNDEWKKNMYYNIKKFKEIIEEKEYDYDFFVKYTDMNVNSREEHRSSDDMFISNRIEYADVCYEKINMIKNIVKNKEYDYDFVLKNIKNDHYYSLGRSTVEQIINIADIRYSDFTKPKKKKYILKHKPYYDDMDLEFENNLTIGTFTDSD